MSKFVINKQKHKNLPKEELLKLNKEELVEIIIRLESHNLQLRNVILKNNDKNAKLLEISPKTKKQRSFDFSKFNTRRIFLRLAYLGGKYQGLATQEDSIYTIEHFLFSALKKTQLIQSRDQVNYHRCGRTDKGVSATGQVISLIIRSKLSEDEINSGETFNELPYCKILNRLLPNDIRAISWMPILNKENSPPLSARFDCKYRTYKYWFPKCLMNIEPMKEACKYLVGSHDFRNLCKMDVGNGVTSFIRRIHSASIISEKDDCEPNVYSMFYIKIVGNAFLWHQIRCIAAVLFLIGNGKEDASVIKNLLDVENFPQKPQYNMAVEFPLNLFNCAYDEFQDTDVDSKNHKSCPSNESASTKMIEPDNDNLEIKDFITNNWHIEHENLMLVIKNFYEQWMLAAIQASMIKDVIDDLFSYYDDENDSAVFQKRYDKMKSEIFHGNSLLQGVKAKNYIPLLKRNTCETLENRINHYIKRKRITETTMDDDCLSNSTENMETL